MPNYTLEQQDELRTKIHDIMGHVREHYFIDGYAKGGYICSGWNMGTIFHLNTSIEIPLTGEELEELTVEEAAELLSERSRDVSLMACNEMRMKHRKKESSPYRNTVLWRKEHDAET